MKENEFNTIIKNSLSPFAYKISDVGGGKQQRRPFDGFGLHNGLEVKWEAKRLSDLKAFSIKELFEGSRKHQMQNFEMYFQSSSNTLLWVPLLIDIPRKQRVYTFTYEYLRKAYKEGITSLLKKDLENIPFTSIKKKIINTFNPISVGTN